MSEICFFFSWFRNSNVIVHHGIISLFIVQWIHKISIIMLFHLVCRKVTFGINETGKRIIIFSIINIHRSTMVLNTGFEQWSFWTKKGRASKYDMDAAPVEWQYSSYLVLHDFHGHMNVFKYTYILGNRAITLRWSWNSNYISDDRSLSSSSSGMRIPFPTSVKLLSKDTIAFLKSLYLKRINFLDPRTNFRFPR